MSFRNLRLALALGAVVSIFGISTSSASALEFKTLGGTALAGESVSGQGEAFGFTLEAAGVTVNCPFMSATGSLAASARATGLTFSFSGCSANKTCTVSSLITTNWVEARTSVSGGASYTKFEPIFKTFVEITFGGVECALFGKQPVTGSVCAVGNNSGVYAVEQPLVTPTFGCASSLKLGANFATLSGKGRAKLSGGNSGQFWGVV